MKTTFFSSCLPVRPFSSIYSIGNHKSSSDKSENTLILFFYQSIDSFDKSGNFSIQFSSELSEIKFR